MSDRSRSGGSMAVRMAPTWMSMSPVTSRRWSSGVRRGPRSARWRMMPPWCARRTAVSRVARAAGSSLRVARSRAWMPRRRMVRGRWWRRCADSSARSRSSRPWAASGSDASNTSIRAGTGSNHMNPWRCAGSADVAGPAQARSCTAASEVELGDERVGDRLQELAAGVEDELHQRVGGRVGIVWAALRQLGVRNAAPAWTRRSPLPSTAGRTRSTGGARHR